MFYSPLNTWLYNYNYWITVIYFGILLNTKKMRVLSLTPPATPPLGTLTGFWGGQGPELSSRTAPSPICPVSYGGLRLFGSLCGQLRGRQDWDLVPQYPPQRHFKLSAWSQGNSQPSKLGFTEGPGWPTKGAAVCTEPWEESRGFSSHLPFLHLQWEERGGGKKGTPQGQTKGPRGMERVHRGVGNALDGAQEPAALSTS